MKPAAPICGKASGGHHSSSSMRRQRRQHLARELVGSFEHGLVVGMQGKLRGAWGGHVLMC
jgi:hypothetical protein